MSDAKRVGGIMKIAKPAVGAAIIAVFNCATYGQTRAIDKACMDVTKEQRQEITDKAKERAKENTPLTIVSKSVREWVKATMPTVPDGCAVELVRDVVAQRDETAKQSSKKSADAANAAAWEALSDVQKRWLVFNRETASLKEKPSFTCLLYIPGMMGKLDEAMRVTDVVGPYDVIVDFECPIRGEQDTSVWIHGVETHNLVDGKLFNRFEKFDQVFWIPGTKTYTTTLGGTRTVYYMERIPDAEKILAIRPPAEAKLADFNHLLLKPGVLEPANELPPNAKVRLLTGEGNGDSPVSNKP